MIYDLVSHVGNVFSRNLSVQVLNSYCLNRRQVHGTTQNVSEVCNNTWNNPLKRPK